MMKDDKLIELFEFYTKVPLEIDRLPDVKYSVKVVDRKLYDIATARIHVSHEVAAQHAAWMAAQAIDFIKEAQALDERLGASTWPAEVPTLMDKSRSRREKAHRWLGFIQGVFWMSGVFTLDELKEHSRKCSDDPEKPDA